MPSLPPGVTIPPGVTLPGISTARAAPAPARSKGPNYVQALEARLVAMEKRISELESKINA